MRQSILILLVLLLAGSAQVLAQDSDGDLIPDAIDNCPFVCNPSQADNDNDQIGNACCCVGIVDGGGIFGPNISTLTRFVSSLFMFGPKLACPAEFNFNGDQSCSIDISDLVALVNHLFITFEPLPACMDCPEC